MTERLLESNPTAFFRGLIREALEEQRVEPSEHAEFYLVTLLERFVRLDAGWLDRPLALDYLESFESETHGRYQKLKHVGDTALFLTGVFLDSLDRKPLGADYYTTLGGLAYHQLATLPGSPMGPGVVPLFTEMSMRFPDFVRVLAQMSLQEIFTSDRDLLRVYRRWLATRGARDADLLIRRGIIPFAPGKALPQ